MAIAPVSLYYLLGYVLLQTMHFVSNDTYL